MFILHVTLNVKSGNAPALETEFIRNFRAAISAQAGFKGVELLRAVDNGDHVLVIAFENQALQQKWVATDLHQQVWPKLERHIDNYMVHTFTTV